MSSYFLSFFYGRAKGAKHLLFSALLFAIGLGVERLFLIGGVEALEE